MRAPGDDDAKGVLFAGKWGKCSEEFAKGAPSGEHAAAGAAFTGRKTCAALVFPDGLKGVRARVLVGGERLVPQDPQDNDTGPRSRCPRLFSVVSYRLFLRLYGYRNCAKAMLQASSA